MAVPSILRFIWTEITLPKQIMHKPKCLQTALLKHLSKPMRGVLKCCSHRPWWIYKKKTINSPWNNREAVREISIHISMWMCYYNIKGTLLLLSILTFILFFFCIIYQILEDFSYTVLAPLTKMTFSMSFDGHQWNIPVESYLFTFMSMFSICSFPGIRRGSCRLRKQQ